MFGAFDEKQLEEYRKEATERWGRELFDASYGRLHGRLSKAWSKGSCPRRVGRSS